MNTEARTKSIPKMGALLLFAGLIALLVFSFQAVGADGNTAVTVNNAPDLYLPLIVKPVPKASSVTPVPFITTGFPPETTITDIANAGDDRLFVVLRQGIIRVFDKNGNPLDSQADPFLDMQDFVQHENWEEGLLGLVFHPEYNNPNHPNYGNFYVTYTGAGGGWQIILRRFSVSADNPNKADINNTTRMMIIGKCGDPDGRCAVHNGGDLNFGPDGYLYVGFGDGGPDPLWGVVEPGDLYNHAQDMRLLLGKMLRIDVDEKPSNLPPDSAANCAGSGATGYRIPADNPFVDGVGGQACDEIWANGLRNPWRFSFDDATGDLYIGDVGEWKYEEIDYQTAESSGGQNYGWHCYEGFFDYTSLYPQIGGDCVGGPYTMPALTYPIHVGVLLECSIVGGFVYRGAQYPALTGQYLYADFCSGKIWRTSPDDGWQTVELIDPDYLISTFGEDVNGELYIGKVDNFGGDGVGVYKITTP